LLGNFSLAARLFCGKSTKTAPEARDRFVPVFFGGSSAISRRFPVKSGGRRAVSDDL
jgi:hypothetical protein